MEMIRTLKEISIAQRVRWGRFTWNCNVFHWQTPRCGFSPTVWAYITTKNIISATGFNFSKHCSSTMLPVYELLYKIPHRLTCLPKFHSKRNCVLLQSCQLWKTAQP